MQEKFKVGDIVKIIKEENTVPEKDGGLGAIGTIIELSGDDVRVESVAFTFRGYAKDSWWFGYYQVELVSEKKAVMVSNKCSRCGGPMVQKKSQGLLSGEFDVMKCEGCGNCQ
jgi:hypothetical protein